MSNLARSRRFWALSLPLAVALMLALGAIDRAFGMATGLSPGAVAASETSPTAVVVNQGDGTLSVCDTTTMQETSRPQTLDAGQPVGAGVLTDVVFVDATMRAYVAGNNGKIYWVDVTSGASDVLATLPDANLVALAVDPATSRLYALDAATGTLFRMTMEGDVLGQVGGLADGVRDLDLAAGGTMAIVTSSDPATGNSTVSTVDLAADVVLGTVTTAAGAGEVTVAGTFAYFVRETTPGAPDQVAVVSFANPNAPAIVHAWDSGGRHASVDARDGTLYVSTGRATGIELTAYDIAAAPQVPASFWSQPVSTTAFGSSRVAAMRDFSGPDAGHIVLVTDEEQQQAAAQEPPPVAAPVRAPTLVYLDESLSLDDLTAHAGHEVLEEYDSCAILDLSDEEVADLQSEDVVVDRMRDRLTIHLTVASFDTPDEPPLPPELKAPATGDGWYIVQAVGPIRLTWRDALNSIGEIDSYLPNYAYVVWLTETQRQTVSTWPWVNWVGAYHPGYRLQPGLQDGDMVVEFLVNRFNQGVTDLQAVGFTVEHSYEEDNLAIVSGPVAAAHEAAKLASVRYISAYADEEGGNNTSRTTIAANVVHGKGITGATGNQIIAITDSGIYTAHEAFTGPKLFAPINYVAQPGIDLIDHGTPIACSAFGDAPLLGTYNKWDGQAFGARGISVRVLDNGIGTGRPRYAATVAPSTIWTVPYAQNGVRINNNSWGLPTPGTYNFRDRIADQVTWQYRDYVLVNIPQNYGPGPSTATSPGLAKNVITVGAVWNSNPQNVWSQSGMGPVPDGRIKPDLMAPGVGIHSATSGTVSNYGFYSGTSMAAPQVSGAAALVREYFMRGFYPSGQAAPGNAMTPTAALVKAVLVNGGRECTGTLSDANGEGRWPNNSQGWGRVHLDDSLYFAGDTLKIKVWDNPATLATGQSWTGTFDVATGNTTVKAALVWTDDASSTAAAVNLVNDLDLEITAPDGTIFLGNNFTMTNPGYSIAGGTFNRRDTTESVHLVPNLSFTGSLPKGTYTIRVRAANIPSPTSNFAVVVTGDLGYAPPPLIAVVGDYRGRLQTWIQANYLPNVRVYTKDNIPGVIRDLDQIDAVVLNHVNGTVDFSDLITAANMKGKGIVFCGAYSYQLMYSPLGYLENLQNDPTGVSMLWGKGTVQMTVGAAHPVTAGFPVSATPVPLVTSGFLDYQTYNFYGGSNLCANAVAPGGVTAGGTWMIGAKGQSQTGGARHVLLGPLGVSYFTGTGNWTTAAGTIFTNSLSWARNANPSSASPVRVAVMGDFRNYIQRYLTWYGYTVTQHDPGDYTGVINKLDSYDVVVLNRADATSGLSNLLAAANSKAKGLVFLGRGGNGPEPTQPDVYGLDALSQVTGDPSAVGRAMAANSAVLIDTGGSSHAVFNDITASRLTIESELSTGVPYSTYTGWSGTNLASAYRPGGTTFPYMIGVKDRQATGGARHVILASFGMDNFGHNGYWFHLLAGKILRNSIQWAK